MTDSTREPAPDDVLALGGSHHGALPADPENLDSITDSIRARAHQLYLKGRDARGDPVSDWLQAEREIRGRSDAGASGT